MQCAVCQCPASSRCSRCGGVWYCGRACQSIAWVAHKLRCVQLPITASTATATAAAAAAAAAAPPMCVRLPFCRRPVQRGDLPSPLTECVYAPSADGIDTNLLILLPGLGDTAANFAKFGTRLSLPQTAILTLAGPVPLPYGITGTGWFDAFEQDGTMIAPRIGDSRRVDGLDRSCCAVLALIDRLLEQWPSHCIFLCGFSHGAKVACHVALQRATRLGGCVCLSSSLLPEAPLSSDIKCSTPMLVTHGTLDDVVPLAHAKQQVVPIFLVVSFSV
jgi:predicted esterase